MRNPLLPFPLNDASVGVPERSSRRPCGGARLCRRRGTDVPRPGATWVPSCGGRRAGRMAPTRCRPRRVAARRRLRQASRLQWPHRPAALTVRPSSLRGPRRQEVRWNGVGERRAPCALGPATTPCVRSVRRHPAPAPGAPRQCPRVHPAPTPWSGAPRHAAASCAGALRQCPRLRPTPSPWSGALQRCPAPAARASAGAPCPKPIRPARRPHETAAPALLGVPTGASWDPRCPKAPVDLIRGVRWAESWTW